MIQIIRERGNWPLIRRSKKQLLEFIFCRNGLNRKPFWMVVPYWFGILKGLDMLVWRLETFGFLYPESISEDVKEDLNRGLS